MPRKPDPTDATPGERRELLDAAMTFAPAVLAAFVLRWALVANAGWAPNRALLASIALGIVVALVLQRAIARRGAS